MSDIRDFEPLWGVWRVDGFLGEGSYGKVYRVIREELGQTYRAAVKHISIPANETEISNLISEGVASDAASAKEYYDCVAQGLVNEIALMSQLKGNTNIVSYEDHQIIPKASGIGYDILIRMELLTGLTAELQNRQFSEQDVIKLGTDICTALEVCAERKIIHRDIKPSNIFVNDRGDFKLGDFGVARQLENTNAGMSRKGTYSYMAPEVYKGGQVNLTADIYSLGLVLYRLLNGNRAPFLPVGTASVGRDDNEAALVKRLSGAQIPAPAFAGSELAQAVMTAVQYDSSKRFFSPTAFKKALLSISTANTANRVVPMAAVPVRTGESLPGYSSQPSAVRYAPVVPLESHVRKESSVRQNDKRSLYYTPYGQAEPFSDGQSFSRSAISSDAPQNAEFSTGTVCESGMHREFEAGTEACGKSVGASANYGYVQQAEMYQPPLAPSLPSSTKGKAVSRRIIIGAASGAVALVAAVIILICAVSAGRAQTDGFGGFVAECNKNLYYCDMESYELRCCDSSLSKYSIIDYEVNGDITSYNNKLYYTALRDDDRNEQYIYSVLCCYDPSDDSCEDLVSIKIDVDDDTGEVITCYCLGDEAIFYFTYEIHFDDEDSSDKNFRLYSVPVSGGRSTLLYSAPASYSVIWGEPMYYDGRVYFEIEDEDYTPYIYSVSKDGRDRCELCYDEYLYKFLGADGTMYFIDEDSVCSWSVGDSEMTDLFEGNVYDMYLCDGCMVYSLGASMEDEDETYVREKGVYVYDLDTGKRRKLVDCFCGLAGAYNGWAYYYDQSGIDPEQDEPGRFCRVNIDNEKVYEMP